MPLILNLVTGSEQQPPGVMCLGGIGFSMLVSAGVLAAFRSRLSSSAACPQPIVLSTQYHRVRHLLMLAFQRPQLLPE